MRWSVSMSVPFLALALLAVAPLRAQGAPAGGAVLSTEAIAARAVPATVTIVTFGETGDTLGMGSGFLVRSTGVLVTNFHVMAGASRAAVILTSGEQYDRVEALDQDAAADLAILKIPGYGLPVLATTAALPPVGARLVAVGNPLGLSRTVSEGIVSAIRLVDGRQLLQMSAAISPGSSGGPVLNAQGQVVAIATAYLKQGQNLNFAVPVRYAMGLVEGAQAAVPLAQAFGDAAPDGGTPTAASTAAPEDDQLTRPARSGHPRSSILGTWELAERMNREGSGAVKFSGYLFLGAHDLGMAALRAEMPTPTPVLVLPVQTHTATADGRVSLTADNIVLDGYQTDAGLFLEATGAGTDGTLHVVAVATPAELPLSTLSGLYDLSGRTDMHLLENSEPGFTSWSGEAAVIAANDSVYVDIYLTNGAGGNAFVTGESPLSGNTFRFTVQGKTVVGTASAGRLYLDWTDRREWGYYQGQLTGQRK